MYHFDVRISAIEKDGRLTGRLIVGRDITKLKETELAFEASLQRTESLYMVAESISGVGPLESLFEILVDKVAFVLPADRVTLIIFNQAAERITHFVAGGPGADRGSAGVLWGIDGGIERLGFATGQTGLVAKRGA